MFDLKNSYPKLIETINYDRNLTIVLMSVGNFLESGNYFIIYHPDINLYRLNLYVGYEMTVRVKEPKRAIGSLQLLLSDEQEQELMVNMTFRDFDDLTLEKSSNLEIQLF